MPLFDTPIGAGGLFLVALALFVACGFEFVNGFHDTANAVATVIYTKTLRPWRAVILSGVCNFVGVYLGGIGVALSILKLLPVELLTAGGTGSGLAMVLALLLAAILWNLGTWYFGLPASSSHTLIGAIIGVGLANSMLPGHRFGEGVNWHKAQEVGVSLLVSPMFGLSMAALLLLLARKLLPSEKLHRPPIGDQPPPGWVRGLLVTTCSGVSFAHGSNDGQKGVGLVMLILIGLLPADFALNTQLASAGMREAAIASTAIEKTLVGAYGDLRAVASKETIQVDTKVLELEADAESLKETFSKYQTARDIPPDQRWAIRSRILKVDSALAGIEKVGGGKFSPTNLTDLQKHRKTLRSAVDYAPSWVLALIAISLGVGTMIGWKRIVVTVGEKIGKSHLTYAQGASAELVAMSTIGFAAVAGLPVSTTHVLSSGIAGTMVAQRSGLQSSTVRNIALAWILTLPAATLLSGGLFLLFRALLPGGPTPSAQAATEPPAIVAPAPSAQAPRSAEEKLVFRVHGSNTMGSELVPRLAAEYLKGQGLEQVTRKVVGENLVHVSGRRPGATADEVIEISAAGSATAFAGLASKSADIGMASRRPNDDEVRILAAAGLGDLRQPGSEHVVGLDGVAVIVHPSNALRSISPSTLADVLAGKTRSWSDVPHAKLVGPIAVYARDEKSGTYDLVRNLLLGETPLAPNAQRFDQSQKLANAVADDPMSLGFVGMSSVRGAKTLAVAESGAPPIGPSAFTIATEDYPLARRLYLYTPANAQNPKVTDFITFALGSGGQAIVTESGFVDLSVTALPQPACASCTKKYVSSTKRSRRLSVNFRFSTGTTELDSRASRDLARIVAYLEKTKPSRVTLLGFSDNVGDRERNVQLSSERAQQVASALEPYGIHFSAVLGFGPEMPVASNDSPAGRDRNRRVEVWVGD